MSVPNHTPSRIFQVSLRAIVLASAISVLISGIGGVLISIFVERPKPGLVVEGIGFNGGADPIRLPAVLVEASRKDAWDRNFRSFETFQTLRQRDLASSGLSQAMRQALDATETWLRANQQPASSTGFTRTQLDSHPLFEHSVLPSALNGMIRRRELEDPPELNLDDGDQQPVYPLYSRGGDPVVHRGNMALRLPADEFYSSEQRDKNELLAHSFSMGNAANIIHYTEAVLNGTRADLDAMSVLREELHKALLLNARLSVEALVTNTGRTSFVLTPNFVAEIGGQNFVETYIMRLTDDQDNTEDAGSSDLMSLLLDSAEREQGSSTPPEEFLPREGGLTYITVPAGETRRLSLLAIRTLDDPTRFKNMYEGGFLPIRLVGFRLNGQSVASEQATFGSDISEADREQIEQEARSILGLVVSLSKWSNP